MEKVKDNIAKERLKTLQKLTEKLKMDYRRKLFNKKCTVLFENKVKDRDEYFGRDEFFNSVIVRSKENQSGKLKEVLITHGNHNSLFGEIDHKITKKNFAA